MIESTALYWRCIEIVSNDTINEYIEDISH